MIEKQSIKKQFQGLQYLKGFGNAFISEVKSGAVSTAQNNPLKCKYGLFAEQLSGSAFTVKRSENLKVWFYKIRPSVVQGQYQQSKYPFKIIQSYLQTNNICCHPNQLRWKSIPSLKNQQKNFIQSLTSLMGSGEPSLKQGISIYAYNANKSMKKEAFYNSDGDLLIVPHQGTIYLKTLNGKLTVQPHEICIIPRGIKFTVELQQSEVKGWVAEVYANHFALPQLGPLGANGLANPVHFEYPTAWFEDQHQNWIIYNKYIGKIYECKSEYSPYDVVGWKGNYSAYRYQLNLFNTIGSISFDHPDPSIFTVLTSKSSMEGTAALDFVIFSQRWLVAQHTFKPPYYHRNCMSEFMGNIKGNYDAKGQEFSQGCSSLHSTMTPHGPDCQSYKKAIESEQKPYKQNSGDLSFMFESGYMLKTTTFAMNDFLEVDNCYHKCWQQFRNNPLKLQQ